MPEPKPMAILAADTHLRKQIQNREGDAEHAFSQICDLGKLYRVPVVIAGDFLDKRKNNADIIDFVTTELDKLADEDIELQFIQGQHELQDIPWLNAVHNLPVHLDAEVLVEGTTWGPAGDYVVGGLDWRPAGQVQQGLALVEGADILIMHQVTQEFMGSLVAHELEFGWVPESVQLLVIGDYHKHMSGVYKNAGGKPMTVLSPGSACMQAINEDDRNWVYLLMDDLSYTSMPLTSRQVLRPSPIMLEEDLDHFVETIGSELYKVERSVVEKGLPPALHTPIMDLAYNENLPNAYETICRAVLDRAHINFQVICDDATEVQEVSRAERQEAVAKGLSGCLPLVLDKEEDPAAFELAARLLGVPDKVKELEKVRKEYFAK